MQKDPKRVDETAQKNLTLLAQDEVGYTEALSQRVDRYSRAKTLALDVADYMATQTTHTKQASKVSTCGDYLVFRHYPTKEETRLHQAYLCKKHLLCPLCAIRRGAKKMQAYLTRFEYLKAREPSLRPFLITLTVKDGQDLKERFNHLYKAHRELWKRKARKRGSVLDSVAGAVASYEVKRGKNSGLWHPHVHMVAMAAQRPDQERLSKEWHSITGDSFIVDVRPINQQDPVTGFLEVFKYAVKFSSQHPADTVHCWETLQGRRLMSSHGCFYGVKVPDELLDEPLEEIPYIEHFYQYLKASNHYQPTTKEKLCKTANSKSKLTLTNHS